MMGGNDSPQDIKYLMRLAGRILRGEEYDPQKYKKKTPEEKMMECIGNILKKDTNK